jgi:hypothetical protein
MVRDTRRDQAYFEDYIAKQEKRISKFQQTLEQLTQSGAERGKCQQCCIYLEKLSWDMLVAQYSIGSGRDTLEKWFAQYCEYVRAQDSLTYNEALNVFSMAILLEKPGVEISAPYPDDSFLDALKAYGKGHEVEMPDAAKLAFPKIFQEFFRCLWGELDAEALRNYIEKKWYSSNREEAWYDSDKRSKGTYCGYWCFAGAAVAKIRGFCAAEFENCAYFPVELLKD